MVAIDFTGSNGDPTYPNSLHHCDPNAFAHGGMNEYERTIAMVGDVLEFYDTDRQYPVYGFGAQLPSGCVSHCFPLTGRRLGARSGRSRGNHEHLSSNADARASFRSHFLCSNHSTRQRVRFTHFFHIELLRTSNPCDPNTSFCSLSRTEPFTTWMKRSLRSWRLANCLCRF